jgi:hypothetical protein
MQPLFEGPILEELDAYFRLSWLFAALIAVMAALLMLLYLKNRHR